MKRGDGIAVGLVVAVLAAIFAAPLVLNCAHTPAPEPNVVVLPERIGSPVAQLVEWLTDQEPKAVTPPLGPTVIFQPADAQDACLLEHEAQHRTDQAELGAGPWSARYLHQLGACSRDRPRAVCLREIPLEAKAYEVQHACQRRRATP